MQSCYFAVDQSGKISRLLPVDFSANKDDLKALLVENTGLLSGNLDTSEDSPEWLLITRKLQVRDPESLETQWECDLVFANSAGYPIFVQCLPDFSGRSRWELIGQMLENAASAQRSLGQSSILEWAEAENEDLAEAVSRVDPSHEETPEEFCARVEDRLEEGKARLIYVAAGYPDEVGKVVDFVNEQVERLDVALVEIREFRAAGFRMLIPSLFGESESPAPLIEGPGEEAETVEEIESDLVTNEASDAVEPEEEESPAETSVPPPLPVELETVAVASSNGNGINHDWDWDEDSFFTAIEQNLAAAQIQAVRTFFQSLQKLAYDVTWAGEEETGALEVLQRVITDQPILTLFSDGKLTFNFGNLEGDDELEGHQQKLRSIVDDRLGVMFTLNELHPSMRPSEWCPKITGLLRVLDDLVSQPN